MGGGKERMIRGESERSAMLREGEFSHTESARERTVLILDPVTEEALLASGRADQCRRLNREARERKCPSWIALLTFSEQQLISVTVTPVQSREFAMCLLRSRLDQENKLHLKI